MSTGFAQVAWEAGFAPSLCSNNPMPTAMIHSWVSSLSCHVAAGASLLLLPPLSSSESLFATGSLWGASCPRPPSPRPSYHCLTPRFCDLRLLPFSCPLSLSSTLLFPCPLYPQTPFSLLTNVFLPPLTTEILKKAFSAGTFCIPAGAAPLGSPYLVWALFTCKMLLAGDLTRY